MALFPDIQARVQAELDSVFCDRLPSVEDKDKTPYLNACIAETMRWHSVLPIGAPQPKPLATDLTRDLLGVPHQLLQDDTYEGYFLPAGTTFIFNTWSVHELTSHGSNFNLTTASLI